MFVNIAHGPDKLGSRADAGNIDKVKIMSAQNAINKYIEEMDETINSFFISRSYLGILAVTDFDDNVINTIISFYITAGWYSVLWHKNTAGYWGFEFIRSIDGHNC